MENVFESNKAIVVLGMQSQILELMQPATKKGPRDILPMIKGEIQYFRERNRVVIFALKKGSGAVTSELSPRTRELVIETPALSAFFHTELEAILNELKMARLTLVGSQTNLEVLYTAADAIQRGFEVAVPETCVWARDESDHFFALKQMREVLPLVSSVRPSEIRAAL